MNDLSTRALTESEARRLTERIRIAAVNYSEAKDKLLTLVQEAKDGAAHVTLGYASWTAYLAEVLGDEPLRLARDERKEVVQLLASEGMSTRAIAPVVGVSQSSIRDDLKVSSSYSPVHEQPAPVTGLDGKTYTRQAPTTQEPSAPKRRPITDQASEAGWELRRAIERLERIFDDDRFTTDKVAPLIYGHLTNAIKDCQTLINRITN